MKIKEITQINESLNAALAYAHRLDSFVRSPVLHYIRNSETNEEAASGLAGYLRDQWDDLDHNDRVDIKKLLGY
jgi:hypothetical protein